MSSHSKIYSDYVVIRPKGETEKFIIRNKYRLPNDMDDYIYLRTRSRFVDEYVHKDDYQVWSKHADEIFDDNLNGGIPHGY